MGASVSKIVLTAGWVSLIAIQALVPLDFNGAEAKRFTAPTQPRDLAFAIIWSTIFLSQGIASILPWCGAKLGKATAPLVARVWKPWVACWTAQNIWAVLQSVQQHAWAGQDKPVASYSLSLALLVASYASMVAGARAATTAVQDELARKDQDASAKRRLQWLGNALYVFPAALNAGWLGLATCLGATQVKIATGASSSAVLSFATALLPIAATTALFVPPALPRVSVTEQTKEPLLASQGAASDGTTPARAVPAWQQWARALSAGIVGAAGYTSGIVWGLANILPADRPESVKNTARVLLGVTPVLSALGVASRVWLARRSD